MSPYANLSIFEYNGTLDKNECQTCLDQFEEHEQIYQCFIFANTIFICQTCHKRFVKNHQSELTAIGLARKIEIEKLWDILLNKGTCFMKLRPEKQDLVKYSEVGIMNSLEPKVLVKREDKEVIIIYETFEAVIEYWEIDEE